MARPAPIKQVNTLSKQLEMRMKYYVPRVFVYLVLVGITSAFLFLSVSYFATTLHTNFNNFKLPLIFHANTVIILVSSYSAMQIKKAAQNDDYPGYLTALLVTFGLGIMFTFFQLTGWRELMKSGINLQNNVAGGYIYIISGLHLLHLMAGLIILGYFALKAFGMKNDAVQQLLFQTDPFGKLHVNLLCLYWHFVDGLWVYLYLFFLVNIYLLRG